MKPKLLTERQMEKAELSYEHPDDYDDDRFIGSGSFAAVYQRNNPTLVTRLAYRDRAYLEYAEWCFEYGHPHGPDIHCIHYADNGSSIVIMERLDPICDLDIEDLFGQFWAEDLQCCDGAMEFIEELDEYERSLITQEFLDYWSEVYERGLHSWTIDIHEKNVMLRPGTGELVITDPWC